MCDVGLVRYDACPLVWACMSKRCETCRLTKRCLGEKGMREGKEGGGGHAKMKVMWHVSMEKCN